MKLLWLTDLHFEWLDDKKRRRFLAHVAAPSPDAVLMTGDLTRSDLLKRDLPLIAQALPCPVYFVLGNHDFYGASFDWTDGKVASLCAFHPNLHHLHMPWPVIRLNATTCLIGHRGWADGRSGVGEASRVHMNDFDVIPDLSGLDKRELYLRLNRLGDESAARVTQMGREALAQAAHLIVATHVPPFAECAYHDDAPVTPEDAPHYVNAALGRALVLLALEFPAARITVLCGHTHCESTFQAAFNLTVRTGGSKMYEPAIAGTLLL